MINTAALLIFMVANGTEVVTPPTFDIHKFFSMNSEVPYTVTDNRQNKKNKKRKHKKSSYLQIGDITLESPYPFQVVITKGEYGYQIELQMIK